MALSPEDRLAERHVEVLRALASASGPMSHSALCLAVGKHRHPDTVRNTRRELEPSLVRRVGEKRATAYEITGDGLALITGAPPVSSPVATPSTAPGLITSGQSARPRTSSAIDKKLKEKNCGSGKRAGPATGDHRWRPVVSRLARLLDEATRGSSAKDAIIAKLREELAGDVSRGKAGSSTATSSPRTEATCSESSRDRLQRSGPHSSAPAEPSTSERSDGSPATTSVAEHAPSLAGGSPPSVSPTETAGASCLPAPASGQTTKASATPAEGPATPTTEQFREALEYRVEKQRPQGFKKSERDFRNFLKRQFKVNPREVIELLDEKREVDEALGRAPPPVPVDPPAIPIDDGWGDARALDALRSREERRSAEAAKQRILENAASRRTST